MSLAVCPGSFDPVTLGHLDVIRRARAMFDEVVVVVAHNEAKRPLLTVDERVALVQTAVVGLDGVMVASWDGLLADFLVRCGASAVVKGLRGGADVDAELGMALLNRHMSGVDTVFVPGDEGLAHVASSLVKDVARHGGAIDDLVPIGVAAVVRAAVTREAARPTGRRGR